MASSYFITGTDTDVGKTLVAGALMLALQAHGKTVAGFKPVSAGCEITTNGLRNRDAVLLQSLSSVELPYNIVNPYAFEDPVAPHIAADAQGVVMQLSKIHKCYQEIASQVDIVIIEGAGGWLVPFDAENSMAEVASQLTDKVILVTAMRLGCLNHTLLTAQSIMQARMKIAGWVANSVTRNMHGYRENIRSIISRLDCPILGEIHYDEKISSAGISELLDVNSLLN